MRTEELSRTLEHRATRGASRVPTDAVSDAARSATRRHRTQRGIAGLLVAAVLVAIGVGSLQELNGSDQAVQVVGPPDRTPADQDPSPEERARRADAERRVRAEAESQRARAEAMSRLERLPMVEHNGIGLRVPEGWHTSGENLTPIVRPPVVASFGTAFAPLPVGGGHRCSQFPLAAVMAMDDDDVLVALIEGAGIRSPERGSSLWDLASDPNDVEIVDCPEWPDGFEARWYPFADSGRAFYLLGVTGPAVTDQRMAELAVAVDSIYVEPAEGTEPSLAVREQDPTSPPPHPLRLTGAIGHVVTINDAPYLIGTSGSGSRRTIEIATDDLVLVGAATDSIHGAIGMSDSSAWGVVSGEVTRVVVEVGDRRFESEVVPLPFDPPVRIWVVESVTPLLRSAEEAPRVIYLDADGNEVVPAPPVGR